MRTTINLPDDLMIQLKKLATATHSTVTALIEETLREGLARRRRSRRSGQVTPPTYGKREPLPKVSDIDILVVWGNRVVIVQAKSKRLSQESRKGNDRVIRDDFMKAVQIAYDQGAACAKSLLGKPCRLAAADGYVVALPDDIKEIYIFCVVSDHYPALSFQARQFLKTESIDRVQAPLVMDVFAIDAMTEILQSPLQFLSYVNRRANYAEQFMASSGTNHSWLPSHPKSVDPTGCYPDASR